MNSKFEQKLYVTVFDFLTNFLQPLGLEGVIIATRDVTFHSVTYLITGSLLLAYQVTFNILWISEMFVRLCIYHPTVY